MNTATLSAHPSTPSYPLDDRPVGSSPRGMSTPYSPPLRGAVLILSAGEADRLRQALVMARLTATDPVIEAAALEALESLDRSRARLAGVSDATIERLTVADLEVTA